MRQQIRTMVSMLLIRRRIARTLRRAFVPGIVALTVLLLPARAPAETLPELALSAMLAIDRPIATPRETRAAAQERWATVIAPALARVAADPPPAWHWENEIGVIQLVRAEVTIADHESHFGWRVHAGLKRGGGAVCLTQLDPHEVRKLGLDPESLVGFDATATERCFRASVTILAHMRELAERECSGAPHWFAPTVAAYGSGKGCVPHGRWVDGVAARAVTYERTGHRHRLPPALRALLPEAFDAS